ncbi:hypothetical protein BBD46_21165 [Natrialba sp. SSL1]|nr:hypothetical protein BBD46_21165 [Natrialba sp. SSL1]
MNLSSHIAKTANTHRSEIRDDGSISPGHNGLYGDKETPVRNTSHWLLTFSHLYQQTGNNSFRNAAERTSSYLRSQDSRPEGWTFHHRAEDGKDACNGLIGQAWTIEALAVAADALADRELAQLAEDVFLMHPQDERTGIWKRVEIDGRTLPFDATFNHQIWFAAAGGILANLSWTSSQIDTRVRRFLDELEQNLRLYPSGLVFHPLKPTDSLRRLLHLAWVDERNRIGVTFGTSSIPLPSRKQQLRWKAIGYHAFNLYAFALLKQQYPDHSFWSSEKCTRSLNYITSSAYREKVWENEYGPAYNPVGFEVPFAMEVFDIGSADERRWWITKQFNRHYNMNTNRMDRNTPDAETLTARLYQATRLSDIALPDHDPI